MCIEKRVKQMSEELERTKKISKTIDLIFSIAITVIVFFVAIALPIMVN